MSKFEITMKFCFNQDELGTSLGTLTSSYRGLVLGIDHVEELVVQQELPSMSGFIKGANVHQIKPSQKTKSEKEKDIFDIVRLGDVNDIILKHARIGDTKTRKEWAKFVQSKSTAVWKDQSIRSHFSVLLNHAIFVPTDDYEKGGKIMFAMMMDSKALLKKQRQILREHRKNKQKAERVAKANKEGLRVHYETR